jgi:uncharacterized membrane protein YfcA
MLTGALIAAAAFVAGVLNTAGAGGAILGFLVLTGTGVAPLTAHATNQLITPLSFLSAARSARGSGQHLALLIAGCVGTVGGVAILAMASPSAFQAVAPWVLIPAAVVVAVQGRAKRRLGAWRPKRRIVMLAAMLGCGVYAGMIGVGTGTLALVVLGMGVASTTLNRLLPVRNVLCLGMAFVVAGAFAITGLVDWRLAALLAVPAVLGGLVGARLVGRLPDPALRTGVVLTATAGAAYLMLL